METLRPMHELLGAHLSPRQSRRVCALSGPSFASEVVARVPTAVVAASRDQGARRQVQSLFQTDRFRVYTNRDLIGVELGGALKNVIALAAGVAAGLELGHNTVAALITRGLAEIGRLGVAMGASAATFAGLVNRLTSLVAGTVATLLFWVGFAGKAPKQQDWVALGFVLAAVAFLSVAERKRARELAASSSA